MEHTEELLKIGYEWLDANDEAAVGLCEDRSCIRCKLTDVLIEIEQLQNTLSNNDYVKCKIEAEIKRLEEKPEGDYITRISALEWVLGIIA